MSWRRSISPSVVAMAVAVGGCAASAKPREGIAAGAAPASRCAPQKCDGEGSCDAVLAADRWTWNGKACVPFYASGCTLAGPGCGLLHPDRDDCARKHADCR